MSHKRHLSITVTGKHSLVNADLILSGSGYGPMAGACENGNDPLGFIKGGEFLDYLSGY